MRRARRERRGAVLARMKVTLKFRRISGEKLASNPNRFRIRAEFEIILAGLRPAKITSREAECEKMTGAHTGQFLCAQRSAGPHRPKGRGLQPALKWRRAISGRSFSSAATRGRRWSGPRRSCRSSRGRRCARGDCTSPRRPRRPRRRRRPSARRLRRRGR